MKRIYVVLLSILPLYMMAQQDTLKEKSKKLELKPYGFIKGDMIYATGGVYSWGSAANCYISSPQFASGKDTSALGFTSQHTRFGLKGTVGEKTKAGGVLELDFYGGAFDANIKPRVRLAYASIVKGGFEARFGQQWDIFSPVNPITNNTNANMWYAGNFGFRRAQILLSYKKESKEFAPMIQASFGETSKEEAALGKDNIAGMPMIQGRLSAIIKEKYEIGISYVTAGFMERKGTIEATGTIKDTLLSDLTYNMSGISMDFNLPFHKYFNLSGEFNTGTNFNDANLFSVAGNYSWCIDDASKAIIGADKKSTGVWVNALSKVKDHFHIVLGYGMDQNKTSNLANGSIESNTVIYGDLIFPINHGYSVALEVQNIATKIKGGNTNTAMIINLSAKVTF